MLALLSLVSVSFADQAAAPAFEEPCDGSTVTYALPGHGSTELPSSVRPFLRFGGCGDLVRVQVVDAIGEVLVDLEHDAFASLSLELPSLDLLPGEYTMRVRGSHGELLDRSVFDVGEDVLDVVPDAPLIAAYSTTYGDGYYEAEVTVEDLPAEGVISIEVEGEDAVLVPVTEPWVYFSYEGDDQLAEHCFTGRVRGVSGVWSEADTVCVTPEWVDYDDTEWRCGTSGFFPFIGCSMTGSPAGGGFLLVSIAGLLLRRRTH